MERVDDFTLLYLKYINDFKLINFYRSSLEKMRTKGIFITIASKKLHVSLQFSG